MQGVELCARAAAASGALVEAASLVESTWPRRRLRAKVRPLVAVPSLSLLLLQLVCSLEIALQPSLRKRVEPKREEGALDGRPQLGQDGDGALELHTTKGRRQGTPRRRQRGRRAERERARRLTATQGPTGARSTGSRSSPCRAAPCARRGCSASLRASSERGGASQERGSGGEWEEEEARTDDDLGEDAVLLDWEEAHVAIQLDAEPVGR